MHSLADGPAAGQATPPATAATEPTVALVFSGGLGLASYHAGAYQAFAETGLPLDWVAGSSGYRLPPPTWRPATRYFLTPPGRSSESTICLPVADSCRNSLRWTSPAACWRMAGSPSTRHSMPFSPKTCHKA